MTTATIDAVAAKTAAGPVRTLVDAGPHLLSLEAEDGRVRAVATNVCGEGATSHLMRTPGPWAEKKRAAMQAMKSQLHAGGVHRIVVRVSESATTRGWRHMQEFVEPHPLRGRYVLLTAVHQDTDTVQVHDGEDTWEILADSID